MYQSPKAGRPRPRRRLESSHTATGVARRDRVTGHGQSYQAEAECVKSYLLIYGRPLWLSKNNDLTASLPLSNGCVSPDGETSPPERSKAKLPVSADALVLRDERDVLIDGLPHDEPVKRVFMRSPRKLVESRRRISFYIHHLETHLPGNIGEGVRHHIREHELTQSVFQGYLPVGCGAYINRIVRVLYRLTGLSAELVRLKHSPKEDVRIK